MPPLKQFHQSSQNIHKSNRCVGEVNLPPQKDDEATIDTFTPQLIAPTHPQHEDPQQPAR